MWGFLFIPYKSKDITEERIKMKKCPYCAEEIQDDAIKCKHCNEFLNRSSYGECTECNSPLNKNSDFCPSCGIMQTHKEPQSSINNLSSTKTKAWYKKWWGVLIIIIFLIAIIRTFDNGPNDQSTNIPVKTSKETQPPKTPDNQSASSSSCDKIAANEVQKKMRGMATWDNKDGKIIVDWGSDWDYADSTQRLGLINAFADSDACFNGAREIRYYRNGRLVGEASPTWGVKLK